MESSALIWQISIVLGVCVFLVIISGKSSLKFLVSSTDSFSVRQTPWRFDVATILFLLYAVLIPSVSLKIATFAVPSLNLDDKTTLQSRSEIVDADVNADNAQDNSTNNKQVDSGAKNKSIATQHPMARLLIRSYGTARFGVVLLTFFLTVVCVAPLTEEFIFRVVMQGAFENAIMSDGKQENVRQNVTSKYKVALVVLLPAIVFSLLHMGTAESPNSPISSDLLFRTTVSSLISNVVVLLIGALFLLRFYKDESRSDACYVPHTEKRQNFFRTFAKLIKNFYRGVVLYLIAAPVILGFNLLLQKIFPNSIIAPVPIFIFAIWNGYVYYKTRQYVACVGTHVALNFTSFVFLLLNVRAHMFGIVS